MSNENIAVPVIAFENCANGKDEGVTFTGVSNDHRDDCISARLVIHNDADHETAVRLTKGILNQLEQYPDQYNQARKANSKTCHECGCHEDMPEMPF